MQTLNQFLELDPCQFEQFANYLYLKRMPLPITSPKLNLNRIFKAEIKINIKNNHTVPRKK